MRPNTSASGIFSTKRRSAVSVSMLTRMLVPKPKNAFQSPVVHNIGRYVDVEVAICGLPSIKSAGLPAKGADVFGIRLPGIRTQRHPPPCGEVQSGRRHACAVPRLNQFSAISHATLTQRACHFGLSAVFRGA